jgi:hypothetical protein
LTFIITSIIASPIRHAAILVIMSVSTFTTANNLYLLKRLLPFYAKKKKKKMIVASVSQALICVSYLK